MIDNLKTIFEVLLYGVGILFLIALIYAIISTPFREAKKKKQIKQISDEFTNALEKVIEESKKEQEKPKRTTKKK